jgi:S-DNA-T family DNA segregation ATPase FtsK/SpoIIIE
MPSNTPNNNASRRSKSDTDETIIRMANGLAKGLVVLVRLAVLFPMVSIPALVSVWAGFEIGPIWGLLIVAASGAALAVWALLSPASFDN